MKTIKHCEIAINFWFSRKMRVELKPKNSKPKLNLIKLILRKLNNNKTSHHNILPCVKL